MKKLPSLNGLRAISILFVVLEHMMYQRYFSFYVFKLGTQWVFPPAYILIDGVGVNVFFVISGFLITYLLLLEEGQMQRISLKNFYSRRALRIFPAYYFLLLFYFIIQHLGYINIDNASWLSAITYTKYIFGNMDWNTAHTWSLSVEEHFYLVWPLIFICGKKTRKAAAIMLILLVPIVRVYQNRYHPYWITDYGLFTRIDAIATGCLFALCKDWIIEKMKPYWSDIFYFSLGLLLMFRVLIMVFNQFHLNFIFIPLGTAHGTIGNFLIAIIMMYSVFGPQGVWFKFLNLKLVNFIGLLSYSIYLWQQFFLTRSNYLVNQFPLNIIFIAAAALFSYYIIERPFLKLKGKFSRVKP